MTNNRFLPELAAAHLFAAHAAGDKVNAFPEGSAPTDIACAYAVQNALIERREAELGWQVAGWKIALTTKAMQQFVGIDHPCAGAIFDATRLDGPATVKASDFVHLNVEAEIAVEVQGTMNATAKAFDRDSVAEHVGSLMAAIELVDDRNCSYDPLDVHLLLADNAFNKGCVLGPRCEAWQGLDLPTLAGEMIINDEVVARGTGADMLGHPLDAFAWLANHVAARGRPLQTGQVVMLGSIAPPRWLVAGDRMSSKFEGLGEANVVVTD